MTTDPRQFLPLKPVELHLLLALAEEELHGYALTRAIAARSDGLIDLAPGNLYQVIKRLLADDLVAEAGRRPAADAGDERRRYYRLTPLGGRVAAAELRRLAALGNSLGARALKKRWAT